MQYFTNHKLDRNDVRRLSPKLFNLMQIIEAKNSLENISDDELLEVTTTFINTVSIPDFLFQSLTKRMEEKEISAFNKRLLNKFVKTLIKRHEVQYTYSVFDEDEYSYNNKWTKSTVNLVRLLLSRLRKSNTLSHHMIYLSLLSQHHLMKDVIPLQANYTHVVNNALRQFISIVQHNTALLKSFDMKDILTIMHICSKDLPKSTLNVAAEAVYSFIIHNLKHSPSYHSDLLLHVYLFASTLVSAHHHPSTQGEPDNLGKMTENLKAAFVRDILPAVLARCNSVIEEIKYDNDIKQTFNTNIYLSDYSHTELLPSIISLLNVTVTPTISSKLVPLFERTCKRWNEKILIDNMICLYKHGMCTPAILAHTMHNLFTIFDYFPSENSLHLTSDIEKTTLLSYVLYTINYINNHKQAVNSQNPPLFILSVVYLHVIDLLSHNDILVCRLFT